MNSVTGNIWKSTWHSDQRLFSSLFKSSSQWPMWEGSTSRGHSGHLWPTTEGHSVTHINRGHLVTHFRGHSMTHIRDYWFQMWFCNPYQKLFFQRSEVGHYMIFVTVLFFWVASECHVGSINCCLKWLNFALEVFDLSHQMLNPITQHLKQIKTILDWAAVFYGPPSLQQQLIKMLINIPIIIMKRSIIRN